MLPASGLPAAMLRLDHHSARPYTDKVSASLAHYENQRATRTSVPARAREAA